MHLKVGKFARTWLVKIGTTLRLCPKGGYPTPPLPFLYNIGNNKELPLPHPMVPANQRCCGGTHRGNGRCSIGRRANGWLKSGRRDRDRAPSHPSRFSWGGRFSSLKLRMRFFSPQIALVFSREHMYFSPEWMSFFSWCKLTNLVNSVISLIQKSFGTMTKILQGGFDQLY